MRLFPLICATILAVVFAFLDFGSMSPWTQCLAVTLTYFILLLLIYRQEPPEHWGAWVFEHRWGLVFFTWVLPGIASQVWLVVWVYLRSRDHLMATGSADFRFPPFAGTLPLWPLFLLLWFIRDWNKTLDHKAKEADLKAKEADQAQATLDRLQTDFHKLQEWVGKETKDDLALQIGAIHQLKRYLTGEVVNQDKPEKNPFQRPTLELFKAILNAQDPAVDSMKEGDVDAEAEAETKVEESKAEDTWEPSPLAKEIAKVLVASFKGFPVDDLKGYLRDTRFDGLDLSGIDLGGAVCHGSQFRGGDLQLANLQMANLILADLQRANLQRANLLGANLLGAKLQQAYLRGADLQQTNLLGANLKEANLQAANLQEASLQRADLQRADLQQAKLQGSKLRGAYLQEAKLQEAHLGRSDLQRAKLQRANLQRADLQQAELQQADLQRADLQEADLQRANLQEADLQQADLQGAKLQRAKLQGAKLQGARLREANLQEARLHGARLQGANLQGAFLTLDQYIYVKDYGALVDPEPPDEKSPPG